MTITFTEHRVRVILAVATRSAELLQSFAADSREDTWDLAGMVEGVTPLSQAVVECLGLERVGDSFVWRVS